MYGSTLWLNITRFSITRDHIRLETGLYCYSCWDGIHHDGDAEIGESRRFQADRTLKVLLIGLFELPQ